MEKETKLSTKWYETLTVKMILLGIMAIMFLIPLQLIKMVIRERESNADTVKQEISESWGKKQTVSGPVLNIPVYRNSDNRTSDNQRIRRIWHIVPEELIIEGIINPEIRYKGIYEAVIYDSDLAIKGHFDLPDDLEKENYTAIWKEAYISMGISDNRGLTNSVKLSINKNKVQAEPGLPDNDLFTSGISFPFSTGTGDDSLVFEINLGLKGSEGMYFTPLGKNTSVKIISDWQSPSFGGHFLPDKREINDDGFSAEWNITYLNRNFPLEWIGSTHNIESESFGIDMILELDHYQKSERSSKYGLLFIAFTFMVLIFMELSTERRIHIFNYFLVSLALVLFFSLLNSLSEHTGFNLAYILASLATISLITAFSGSIMKSRKAYFITGGLLSGLYLFLFFLLSLNEYAYLVGNIGLFIGLASVMWLTSRTEIFKKNEL